MGSVRQRRKQHSTTKKATRKNKDAQRKVNIHSNAIIAENWDYKATLAQNYAKLGLSAKLQKPAGGEQINYDNKKHKLGTVKVNTLADLDSSSDDEEENSSDEEQSDIFIDPAELDENGDYIAERILEGEARIVKDDSGKIINVVYGTMKPFDIDMSIEQLKKKNSMQPKTEVIKLLEEEANKPVVRKERHFSAREDEWISKLVSKHGENYKKMVMDKKLNIYQQTEAALRNKIIKWKEARSQE
ncbi:Nop16 protein [Hanseniaspora uvarum]|nr:Nop16 protein [Hanseniaspora uvarum]